MDLLERSFTWRIGRVDTMDKECFVCKRCGYTMAKEYMGNRPDNWAEEYCQDCGSSMSVVFDNEQITEIIRALFKKN